MKNFTFLIVTLIIGITFSACSKMDDMPPIIPPVSPEDEAPALLKYVTTTPGLEDAVKDSKTGIWYYIEEEGLVDPEDPDFYEYTVASSSEYEYPRIKVKYVGRLITNGSVFEEMDMTDPKYDGKYMSLYNTVLGWKYAFFPSEIEHPTQIDPDTEQKKIIYTGGFTQYGLQKGAKIRIVLPSYYGYQNGSGEGLPANSILDYTIEVLEIKSPDPLEF